MKTKHMIPTIFVAALVSILLTLIMAPDSAQQVEAEETAYERVMRTGVLRCGYNFYEPGFMRNEETQTDTGLYYDLTEKVADNLGIDVEWTAQVGWGDIEAALEANKIDAFCVSVWPGAKRSKRMLFSKPFTYTALYIVARTDDMRFDNDLSKLNDPEVRFAVLEGDITAKARETDFPLSISVPAPALASDAEQFEMIRYNKADVAVMHYAGYWGFNEQHPGVVKILNPDKPTRVFGQTIAVKQGEHNLKAMLDVAITEMLQNGEVEKILAKYEADYPKSWLLPAPEYQNYVE